MSETAPFAPSRTPLIAHPGVRYGLAVGLAGLGSYALVLGSDLAQLANSFLITNSAPAAALLAITRFAFWVLVVAASVLILPGDHRRWVAAALVVVAFPLIGALYLARLSGDVPIPGVLGVVLLSPTTAALLVGGAAWLLARGRRPLSFLLLLLAFVPGFVSAQLSLAQLDHATNALLVTPLAIVIAVGGAWIAALISRGGVDPVRVALGER